LTYKQATVGKFLWRLFDEVKNLSDVSNEKKVNFLIFAAEGGSEDAILMLVNAYKHGWYELEQNDAKSLELSEKYATQGSEIGVNHLLILNASRENELELENSNILKLAEKHAAQGSEKAIYHLLNAYRYGWYKVQINHSKWIELMEFYASKGSQTASGMLKRYLNIRQRTQQ
jgi:hypothetical protein